jgi:hypothetical protein
MAPGRLVTRVVRVLNDDAPLLGDAAQMLATDPVDVVGYASTTSAYAVGFDEETAMVSRLSALLDLPVAATCASAVLALRVLHVERVALVGAPWFDPELNELGAAYFRSQGFDVVSSASAELSRDPQRIDPAAVQAWTSRHIGDEAEGSSSAATASERREQSPGWRPRSAARFSPRIRSCFGISSHGPRSSRGHRLRSTVCPQAGDVTWSHPAQTLGEVSREIRRARASA